MKKFEKEDLQYSGLPHHKRTSNCIQCKNERDLTEKVYANYLRTLNPINFIVLNPAHHTFREINIVMNGRFYSYDLGKQIANMIDFRSPLFDLALYKKMAAYKLKHLLDCNIYFMEMV